LKGLSLVSGVKRLLNCFSDTLTQKIKDYILMFRSEFTTSDSGSLWKQFSR
jgi:hypothetical protein